MFHINHQTYCALFLGSKEVCFILAHSHSVTLIDTMWCAMLLPLWLDTPLCLLTQDASTTCPCYFEWNSIQGLDCNLFPVTFSTHRHTVQIAPIKPVSFSFTSRTNIWALEITSFWYERFIIAVGEIEQKGVLSQCYHKNILFSLI